MEARTGLSIGILKDDEQQSSSPFRLVRWLPIDPLDSSDGIKPSQHGPILTINQDKKTCYAPSRQCRSGHPSGKPVSPASSPAQRAENCPECVNSILIPGGTGLLGADDPEIPEDEEGPVRKRKIKPFRIGETSVTNEQFARFVDETGYVTEADKLGWSYVFHLQVPKNNTDAKTVPGRLVEGCQRRLLETGRWSGSIGNRVSFRSSCCAYLMARCQRFCFMGGG